MKPVLASGPAEPREKPQLGSETQDDLCQLSCLLLPPSTQRRWAHGMGGQQWKRRGPYISPLKTFSLIWSDGVRVGGLDGREEGRTCFRQSWCGFLITKGIRYIFLKNQPEMELRDRTGRIKKKSLIKLITEINKTKKFKSWVCFLFSYQVQTL